MIYLLGMVILQFVTFQMVIIQYDSYSMISMISECIYIYIYIIHTKYMNYPSSMIHFIPWVFPDKSIIPSKTPKSNSPEVTTRPATLRSSLASADGDGW